VSLQNFYAGDVYGGDFYGQQSAGGGLAGAGGGRKLKHFIDGPRLPGRPYQIKPKPVEEKPQRPSIILVPLDPPKASVGIDNRLALIALHASGELSDDELYAALLAA
jgi:hypothetical protein